jgi:NADH:ubiquinone oxidoreductase subunit F (NADH-binding)
VRAPGVAEIELGTTVREVLALFGGMTAIPQAFLVGGYFGTWVSARDTYDAPFTNETLGPLGASLGARLLIVLPQDACGLAETARVVRYLERQSAGQCGSCFFGLPAIATAFELLASGAANAPKALERLSRLVPQVEGRGACALPTGATRLVTSALRVFAPEVDRHHAGRCSGLHRPPVIPVPDTDDPDNEWS